MTANEEAGGGARRGYAWAARGDINAFFGLMLDNIGVMILMTALLTAQGFPRDFVLARMIPGTAIGVLVGDLIFTVMAFLLARRIGRSVTAMPLGLDTPSTFGMVALVLIPAFAAAKGRGLDDHASAQHAAYIGMSILLVSGVFKLACAPIAGWIRTAVPRAGLLGSLAAIALVLISFLPLLDVAAQPVTGLTATMIILATLTAKWGFPREIPGALASVAVGCLIYYAMWGAGLGPGPGGGELAPGAPRPSLPLPLRGWWAWFLEPANWAEVLKFLPIALPMALATVVGGIDCTESAASVGDTYSTGGVIAAEGFSTLVAGVFGGVIQSTPYIGHPAYKVMGGRAAFTLATALFVGGAGVLGYFEWIFYLVPKAAIFPILIFVGVEITASSYLVTARKHYPALALSCVPALAYLALILANQVLQGSGREFAELPGHVQHLIQTLTTLSNGFIVTSLIWGAALAQLIDGKMRACAATFATASALTFFGVIHSPLPSSPIERPWVVIRDLKAEKRYEATEGQTPYHWSAAYLSVAAMVLIVGRFGRRGVDSPHE